MLYDASTPTREETCVSTRRSWLLFAAALALVLTVPRMAQPGMFGDGLLYATIARNMSLGVGSLWAPAYTETTWPAFFEHPPLGFALQAIAFWLLGDSLVVERLFSLAIFGAHALIVMAIWRRLQPPALDWLPLLFWLLPSTVSWSIVNNMLENVQALFTSLAVLLLLAGATATRRAETLACGAAAAVAMVSAVLTKGPAGLFPLAAIGVLPLIVGTRDAREPRELRESVQQSPRLPRPARGRGTSGRLVMLATVTLATIALCAAALALYEPSRAALTMYVETQLAPSIRGERGVSAPHGVTRHLTLGIAGRMAALLAVACLLGRRGLGVLRGFREEGVRAESDRVGADRAEPDRLGADGLGAERVGAARLGADRGNGVASTRAAAFFCAMAFAGSWPLALSPRLSGHYLLPSVPFFALAFAALAARSVTAWLALDAPRGPMRGRHLPRALAAIMLGVALLLPILHGPLGPRDALLLRDLAALDAAMPRKAIIGACPHASGQPDWGLHTYVQRWFRVSLDPRGLPAGGWMLVTHGDCTPPPTCTPAARGTTLSLFRCAGSEQARWAGERGDDNVSTLRTLRPRGPTAARLARYDHGRARD